jgi:hypothetical protein
MNSSICRVCTKKTSICLQLSVWALGVLALKQKAMKYSIPWPGQVISQHAPRNKALGNTDLGIRRLASSINWELLFDRPSNTIETVWRWGPPGGYLPGSGSSRASTPLLAARHFPWVLQRPYLPYRRHSLRVLEPPYAGQRRRRAAFGRERVIAGEGSDGVVCNQGED